MPSHFGDDTHEITYLLRMMRNSSEDKRDCLNLITARLEAGHVNGIPEDVVEALDWLRDLEFITDPPDPLSKRGYWCDRIMGQALSMFEYCKFTFSLCV